MPLRYITLSLLITLSLSVLSQEYKPVENFAFQEGESLTFRVYYHSTITGKLTAGLAYLDVLHTDSTFKDREVHRIKGYGKTKGVINWFIKVREHFESFTDKEALVPHFFTRDTREGDFRKKDEVIFDHGNLEARSWRDTTTISSQAQDILSAFFFARNFKIESPEIGDMFYLDYFIDDSLYISAIQFDGYDTIKTDYGTFRCMAFKPKVAVGQVFKDPYPGVLWVTDDDNHLPVLAESEVFIGSVKLELIEAKGIRNEETSRIDGKKKRKDRKKNEELIAK